MVKKRASHRAILEAVHSLGCSRRQTSTLGALNIVDLLAGETFRVTALAVLLAIDGAEVRRGIYHTHTIGMSRGSSDFHASVEEVLHGAVYVGEHLALVVRLFVEEEPVTGVFRPRMVITLTHRLAQVEVDIQAQERQSRVAVGVVPVRAFGGGSPRKVADRSVCILRDQGRVVLK